MKVTWKEIMNLPVNPWFGMRVENGVYQTENKESYYAAKLPKKGEKRESQFHHTFSYDVSNNKVLANVDEYGTVELVTFYRNHYVADDIPGVWVCKDFGQAGPFSYGLTLKGETVDFAAGAYRTQSDLLDNLFPRVKISLPKLDAVLLSYAPVGNDGKTRLRVLVYGLYLENRSQDEVAGSILLPRFFPKGGDCFAMPDVSGETVEVSNDGKRVLFSLGPGKTLWIPTILYAPGENEDVKKLKEKGTLYWFEETRSYFRKMLGQLNMPEDPMTAALFERAVYQGFGAVGMNREGKICGSNWGTFPATRQIWMKDMYYSFLPLSILEPAFFAQGCLWFLENGIRPGGARYAGGVAHSLSNSLTGLLMAILYYESTGDKPFFEENPQIRECSVEILEEVLTLRGKDCWLFETTWISDALALGKYHTGSNLCAWKAFAGMARLMREVWLDFSKAAEYERIAGNIKRDIETYMVTEGKFGRQYLEGIGGLTKETQRTYPLSTYNVEYVEQAKTFYPDIIEGEQVNLLMHDGEESDTTLMSFYRYKTYDDEVIRNYVKFTTSEENPTWGTECRGIKWGHESGATFPGYITAFSGVVDADSMNGETGYLRELKRLADLDGSWWWWPYKVGAPTGDVERLNCCGKCGWASGVFAATFITQILGLTWDAPSNTLHFRPFCPCSSFSWEEARLGSGLFDVYFETGRISVVNLGEEPVNVVMELITDSTAIYGPNGKETDWEEGSFLGKRTVIATRWARPRECAAIMDMSQSCIVVK